MAELHSPHVVCALFVGGIEMPVVQSKEVKKTPPKQEARVDEQVMLPGKYEVTPEHTFTIKMHLQERDGRWVLMQQSSEDTTTHEVIFRMWTYDEMVDLKKKATIYEPQRKVHIIDNDALNRLKVQRLLKSWTFDEDNPRLKLLHVNGVLADEGWENFKRLQPNIIEYILSRMNDVYELGH